MILEPALMIVVAFSFGSAIFHTLLGVERRVWRLASASPGAHPDVPDDDIRFTHRMLKHLSGWLPASNGVVMLFGLPGLIWQGIATSWSGWSLAVLGYWLAFQIWIMTAGRIAGLVRDLRAGDSDGPVEPLVPVVRGLIRQHRNGLLQASGTLFLQIGFLLAETR